ESYSSRRISEPVTVTRSSVTASSGSEEACSCGCSACCASACGCGSSGCCSCANAAAPYRHPKPAAASGTSFRLANVFLPLEPVIAYLPSGTVNCESCVKRIVCVVDEGCNCLVCAAQ